ncbi:hypothetical protein MPSEU_000636300 [Mayamaea pseudoterrestris]|nr:hypothetical protein MPSEU_000636300 [Mayamaea pseudoterrestris]
MIALPVTHSCPFAAALDADESSVNSNSSAVPLDDVKRCPAFQDSSCPFKDAKSSEEIRQTLAKVPPSHYQVDGKFFRVIRELHNVQVNDEAFQLPGGCPVQQQQRERREQLSAKSFHDAMEDFSFAAIMASLAKQEEEASGFMTLETESSEMEKPDPIDAKAAVPTFVSSPASSSRATSLSQSLKTGTAASHQAAEDVHFVANFIKGKIDRKLYAQLVHMLFCVYQALEECLDQEAQEHFPSCHFPKELGRMQSLEQDLDFWLGSNVPSTMTSATRDYVNRIHEIAESDPLLLLAHSYTRYLGDLSGGRILARVAKRAMHLGGTSDVEPVEGLAFYHFENVESPKKFKDKYRSLLDALPLDQDQIDKLVAEANVAFLLNVRLFEELDVMANVKGASVRPLQDAFNLAGATKESNLSANVSDKCPFADLAKKQGTQDVAGKTLAAAHGHCPWPFILAHDPLQGCRDWKTWATAGLALCWIWSLIKP